MRKNWKYVVLILIAATFLSAIWCGVERYGFPDRTSTVRALDGPWTYEIDPGDTGIVYLPWNLEIPAGTNRITLTSSLPEWET